MAEMPNVISGNTITSTWGNQIRDRTIQRYANTAERTSENPTPGVGDLAFMEDTGVVWVYYGSSWRSVGPQGLLGYAERTAVQSGITTIVDITGLTVTFTLAGSASRRIRTTVYCPSLTSTVSGDRGNPSIRSGGGTVLQQYVNRFTGTSGENGFNMQVIESLTGGPHTRKATYARVSGGTGTHTFGGDTTSPSFILAEDIGPV